MVYDIESQIIYQPREFGIFGLDSLRVVEGIYAHHYKKHTGLEIEKCFLIKTGRHPNKYELDYQKRLDDGENAPHGVYKYNWMMYSVQNIVLKYPILPVPTRIIRTMAENVFGHKLGDPIIFQIDHMIRDKIYDFKKGYYGANVWQIMGVVAALNSINVDKNDTSIRLMFNKIYKRDPIYPELPLCKKLVLSNNPEDIENEIEQFTELQYKKIVSAKRKPR